MCEVETRDCTDPAVVTSRDELEALLGCRTLPSLSVTAKLSEDLEPLRCLESVVDRLEIAGNTNLQKLADSHLVGLIEPEDIAHCALYLASDESRMITGQVIPVDSGVTIS